MCKYSAEKKKKYYEKSVVNFSQSFAANKICEMALEKCLLYLLMYINEVLQMHAIAYLHIVFVYSKPPSGNSQKFPVL